VLRRRLTRRDALGLGAAAFAAGALRSGPALANPTSLFELDLAGEGARAAAAGGWRTTGVLRAPRRFDLIGLRWARGAAVEAEVRARRRGGDWSAWVPLHPRGDHRPDDDDGTPAGTDPAWTGPADLFQLRLRGSARGLRARFVRTRPTAAVARRAAARLRRRRGRRSAGGARAAQAGPPVIITRTEWGGDTVPPRAAPGYGQVQLAFVHHTVTANDYGPADSAAIVLGIARYHRDSNGWNDVGYNFLVDKYGQVFEGRAGGIDQAVVGAQAQGWNSVSTGIACLGTFSEVAQSEPGMDALARLIGWKLSLHGVPVQGEVTVTSAGGSTNRYPAGTPVAFARVAGHRDGNETTCPGDALYAQLPALRERAARNASPVSRVTARPTTRRVRALRPVTLSGDLRFADGSSPSGAPLAIEFQAVGAAWQQIGTATCAPDGRWTGQVALPRSGLVRAVYGGGSGRPRLESAPTRIRVLPKVGIEMSAKRMRVGRRITVRGTVEPIESEYVTLTVQRRSRRRWRTVERRRLRLRDGAYRGRVRLRRTGRYRVSISVGGTTRRRLLRAVTRRAFERRR
jgi:uncharacterized protein with LGFP repeats